MCDYLLIRLRCEREELFEASGRSVIASLLIEPLASPGDRALAGVLTSSGVSSKAVEILWGNPFRDPVLTQWF